VGLSSSISASPNYPFAYMFIKIFYSRSFFLFIGGLPDAVLSAVRVSRSSATIVQFDGICLNNVQSQPLYFPFSDFRE